MKDNLAHREKRTFSHEFKKQIVILHQNGKKRSDIVSEYNLTKSALDKWIMQHSKTDSFSAQSNRCEDENELLRFRKELK